MWSVLTVPDKSQAHLDVQAMYGDDAAQAVAVHNVDVCTGEVAAGRFVGSTRYRAVPEAVEVRGCARAVALLLGGRVRREDVETALSHGFVWITGCCLAWEAHQLFMCSLRGVVHGDRARWRDHA